MRLLASLLAVLALVLGACSAGSSHRKRGASAATVEGAAPAAYADAAAAKAAFTRGDGPMTATLYDVAWIRLEPDPTTAAERYPEYFQGYTTVGVSLRTDRFVQPTKETYVLEDSTGARVSTSPERYKGDTLRGFGPKHAADFVLVFPHVLSKDVAWVKLTRVGDGGGTVQWDLR